VYRQLRYQHAGDRQRDRHRKTSAAAGAVKVGDSIAYTLTAVVSNSRTTAVFTLTDTMGPGLTSVR
jgi:hypothetical protein